MVVVKEKMTDSCGIRYLLRIRLCGTRAVFVTFHTGYVIYSAI